MIHGRHSGPISCRQICETRVEAQRPFEGASEAHQKLRGRAQMELAGLSGRWRTHLSRALSCESRSGGRMAAFSPSPTHATSFHPTSFDTPSGSISGSLSYRGVEELLAERGLDVSYETVRRWVLKFGPAFARNLRRLRPRPSAQWHLDEMAVVIRGKAPVAVASRRQRGRDPGHARATALRTRTRWCDDENGA